MAYNSAFPMGYQYMMPQQQPQQQAYLPPQMQQPTQQPPQNNIIWVQGEAGAKSYMVAPNTTVQLWDSEAQTIYLKSADASGMPTTKVLDYTIREQAQQAQAMPSLMQDSTSEYVTKDEFSAFSDRIQRQIDRINGRRGDKNNGKQTLSADEQ